MANRYNDLIHSYAKEWVNAVQDAKVEDVLQDWDKNLWKREREMKICPWVSNDQKQATKRNRKDTWVGSSCRNRHVDEWITELPG